METKTIGIITETPSPVITFHNVPEDEKNVGQLTMSPEGVLSFEGDMDKSAEIFIENVLKPMWQKFINKEKENG